MKTIKTGVVLLGLWLTALSAGAQGGMAFMEHDWTVRIGGRQFGVEQARDAYSSRRWTTIHWGGAQTTLKVRAALFIGLGLLSVPAVGALALSAPRELRRE